MRTIYLDSEFKCHVSKNDLDMLPLITDYFDYMPDYYVESHIYIPNEVTFNSIHGPFVYAWRNPYYDPTLAGNYEVVNMQHKLKNEYIKGVNSV